MLVDPSETRPSGDHEDWFELHLDPAAEQPGVLPVAHYEGDSSWSTVPVVEVTGMFDHPAAAACTYTTWEGAEGGESVPSHACRLEFAVTRLVVQGR